MKIIERTKIRLNQLWKKRDTGCLVVITGKRGSGMWCYRKMSGSRKSHGVQEKDLWLFWEKL